MAGSASGSIPGADGASGMWIDGPGGLWMDPVGVAHVESAAGPAVGLQPANVVRFNDQNIVAHMALGDSLEITMSQLGAERAQNASAHEFAQRMVAEHASHLQAGVQAMEQSGVNPARAAIDTMETPIAGRMLIHLRRQPNGTAFDKQLLAAEVMTHRHMLHDLEIMRLQATGATRAWIDQTIPVVRQHLDEARRLQATVAPATAHQDAIRAFFDSPRSRHDTSSRH